MYIERKKSSTLEELRKKNKPQKKIKQKLSFTMLDLIASYIISNNRNIRNKGYNNIQNFMELLDRSLYQDDLDFMRFDFIQAALDARLKHKLVSKEQVIDYINASNADKPRFNMNLQEISNDEVNYINTSITNLLDTAEFDYRIHEFEGMAKDFSNATPFHKKEIIDDWKDLIYDTNNSIRMNKVEKADDEILCLSSGFDEYARQSYSDLSNPSNKLSTGMQGFNYLLGGGYENGRCYCFFGLQGEGKSITLLDTALQIKRYNRKFKPKDPTKTPVVVYLTLENTKRETFQRLFVQSADAENQYTDYDVDQAISMMKNDGGLVVSDDNPIDIVIKAKAPDSVDTGYLYELNDDLADKGFEVICYIIDYLKIIKSVNRFSASEERLKLGSVVKEFKSIAAELDIPIITASQFNRDANAKVDDARSNSSSTNTIKLVGRANIGESMLILDNIDGNFMIVPEFIQGIAGTAKYLGIKLAKARYKPNLKALEGSTTIHQPYTRFDGIKLVEDVGRTPVYKLTLDDMAEMNTDTRGTVVDKDVKIPDNSNRYKETIIPANIEPEKKEESTDTSKKTYLDENGKELGYNPNWRDEPEFKYVKDVGEIMNVDALPPEQQIRIRQNAKEVIDNFNNPKPFILPGPSRYSDEYTVIYDPYGSKEERLAHDYNLMYDKQFTENEFWMLKEHLDKVKRHELKEEELKFSPFYHCEKNIVSNPFIKINEVERRASLRHSSVHDMIYSMM